MEPVINYMWQRIDYSLPVDSGNYVEMERIKNDWLRRLREIRNYNPNSFSVSKEEVIEFIEYIIRNQHSDGSYCLPINFEGMPSDTRVNLVYFPTYLAIACLCIASYKIKSIKREIPDFNETLRKGLDFASGRDLSGHGYDSTIELIEAVNILSLGYVLYFCKNNPDVSPMFNHSIRNAKKQIKEKLHKNEGWSAINEDSALLALKYLDGEKNTDTYERNGEKVAKAYVEKSLDSIISSYKTELITELVERKDELSDISLISLPKYTVFKSNKLRANSEPVEMTSTLEMKNIIDRFKDADSTVSFNLYKTTLIEALEDELLGMPLPFEINNSSIRISDVKYDDKGCTITTSILITTTYLG